MKEVRIYIMDRKMYLANEVNRLLQLQGNPGEQVLREGDYALTVVQGEGQDSKYITQLLNPGERVKERPYENVRPGGKGNWSEFVVIDREKGIPKSFPTIREVRVLSPETVTARMEEYNRRQEDYSERRGVILRRYGEQRRKLEDEEKQELAQVGAEPDLDEILRRVWRV